MSTVRETSAEVQEDAARSTRSLRHRVLFLLMAAFFSSSTAGPSAATEGGFAADHSSVLAGHGSVRVWPALGCYPPGSDRFCLEDYVTQEQMAAFLGRALELAGDVHGLVAGKDAGPRLIASIPPRVPRDAGFRFTAGGDIGAEEESDATFQAMAARKGHFFLALGDLSYGDLEPETAWCDYVKGYLGEDFPVQVVVGNHEDQDREDGFIRNFAECLPDRMSSVGDYGIEYYFDVGSLARVIMLAAREDVDGVDYDYEVASDRMAWLNSALEGAEDKEWVIVGMHRPCLSAGEKTCEIGPDLMNRLIEARVDLVLQAHDHTYQRSKQLRCAEVDNYVESCVTDDGSDGVYPAGEGTVFVVSGVMGGAEIYDIDPDDPEYPYFAETLGGGDPQAGYGFSVVSVDQDSIDVEFVGTTTDYTDSFTIR